MASARWQASAYFAASNHGLKPQRALSFRAQTLTPYALALLSRLGAGPSSPSTASRPNAPPANRSACRERPGSTRFRARCRSLQLCSRTTSELHRRNHDHAGRGPSRAPKLSGATATALAWSALGPRGRLSFGVISVACVTGSEEEFSIGLDSG